MGKRGQKVKRKPKSLLATHHTKALEQRTIEFPICKVKRIWSVLEYESQWTKVNILL